MRVAVIVPGIMGSTLHYEDGGGRRTELWGEDFTANYQRIIDHPDVLALSNTVPNAAVLEKVDILGYTKMHLWKRMLDWLLHHPDFSPETILKLGYDWRRSLVASSLDFASELENRTAALAAEQSLAPDEIRLVFVSHSMGGLLLRCAIAQDVISTGTIDSIIHVGTPLEGAPGAFSGTYKTVHLPHLEGVARVLHPFKNTGKLIRRILDVMQKFPSAYQLMPPVGQNYLFYSGSMSTNPFVDPHATIPDDMKHQALHARQLLMKAEQKIFDAGLSKRTYTIYTERNSDEETEVAFNVAADPGEPGGYEILHAIPTEEGDGTVPASSARGRLGYSNREPVKNVRHVTMCDDKEVVDVMPAIL
jgi:hypothetical protein